MAVLKYKNEKGFWQKLQVGTNVVANSTAVGTDTLTKLTVGDTTYNIPSGGGSGPTYSAGTHITIDPNNAINAEWPTAADTGYEGVDKTGTITGIKMNGEVKGTEGVVDLGMVISEEQYANCAKLVGGNLFHGTQQIVGPLIVGSDGIRTNGVLSTGEGKILKPLSDGTLTYEYTLPDKSGTLALTSDIPDALPKPSNDSTGSAGQVLKKTANGSEWGDAPSGGGKLYRHDIYFYATPNDGYRITIYNSNATPYTPETFFADSHNNTLYCCGTVEISGKIYPIYMTATGFGSKTIVYINSDNSEASLDINVSQLYGTDTVREV